MIPTLSVVTDRPDYNLYNFSIVDWIAREPVIIKVTLKNRGSKVEIQMDHGDETFNLSAVLGNKDGEFEWGSGGFEQSATNPRIETRGLNQRFFCVDLQNATGGFNQKEFNLDEKFELVEYVHRMNKDPFYKLGMKKPLPPRRTLVLCFDGTSNHFSNQNTNVVKLMELLKKTDPSRQMVYYQTGVGTYAPPSVATDLGLFISKKADEGLAWYLYQHVIDGYKYLVQTYQIGDRISIFGFSRGAFTARALAGMVHCVGLLPRHNIEHIPFAYEIYKNANDKEDKSKVDKPIHGALQSPTTAINPSPFSNNIDAVLSDATNNAPATMPGTTDLDTLSRKSSSKPKNINPNNFKKVFCMPVAIDFVGVWDTVASVGSIFPKRLPWINYNPSIRNFRQALALDERRGNFIPSVWDHERTNPDTQNVQEVWFKGGHTDVGGGAPVPKRAAGQSHQSFLSNIPLRWMVRQCLELDTGIIFDFESLSRYRHADVLESRPTRGGLSAKQFEHELLQNSAELDKNDIVHKPYDAMRRKIGWNLLEFWPSSKPTQQGTKLDTTSRPNVYKPRSIYRPKIDWSPSGSQSPVAIHASVVNFLQAHQHVPGKGKDRYVPSAIWHGYSGNQLPWIEDGLKGGRDWSPSPKATAAMKMCRKTNETQGQPTKEESYDSYEPV